MSSSLVFCFQLREKKSSETPECTRAAKVFFFDQDDELLLVDTHTYTLGLCISNTHKIHTHTHIQVTLRLYPWEMFGDGYDEVFSAIRKVTECSSGGSEVGARFLTTTARPRRVSGNPTAIEGGKKETEREEGRYIYVIR